MTANLNDLCIGELAEIVGGRLQLGSMPPLGGRLEPLGRIVVDSRRVGPGEVFWGLPGRRHDGSQYAEQALIRRALGVVVAGRHVEPWAGAFSLQVEDTRVALWELACWMRRRFRGRLIAVAGTAGTETVRQTIDAVLGSHLAGTSLAAGGDPLVSIPLGLLGLAETHDYGVLDFGHGSREKIEALSHLCCPQIAVITSAASGATGSPAAAPSGARPLAELLAVLPDHGWAVLNGDDPDLRRAAAHCPAQVLWVGRGAGCDLRAERVTCRDGRLSLLLDQQPVCLPGEDPRLVEAALAAYAVGKLAGIRPPRLAAALTHRAKEQGPLDISEAPPFALDLREFNAALPPGPERFAC